MPVAVAVLASDDADDVVTAAVVDDGIASSKKVPVQALYPDVDVDTHKPSPDHKPASNSTATVVDVIEKPS